MVDQPADRVVLVGVLEPQVGVEQLGEVIDVGAAVDAGLILGQPDDHRLLGVVLILDLADDLLEEVLDRDQAGGPAILVEDDRDVDLPPLELVEEVVDRHRLGHEHGRPQQRAERGPLARTGFQDRQEILGVEDADDLVDRLLVDRDPAMALLDDLVDRFLERRRCGQARDRDPRHHDLVEAALPELDDRVDHLLLLRLENALLAAPLDDQPELLGGDLRLVGHVRAEQRGDPAGDSRQDGDQGAQRAGEEVDRDRQGEREPLGARQGEGLRDELREDDREQGEADGHDQEGDALGGPAQPDRGQECLEGGGEVHRCIRGREEPDHGQAELGDREEAAGIVEQAPDAARSRAALLRQLLDAAAADRDERDLCRHEEALEQGQDDDDEDVEH